MRRATSPSPTAAAANATMVPTVPVGWAKPSVKSDEPASVNAFVNPSPSTARKINEKASTSIASHTVTKPSSTIGEYIAITRSRCS